MPPRVDEPPNDAAPCNSKEQVPWERVRVGSRRLMTDDTQHPPWPSPNRAPDRRVSGRKRGWRGIHGGIRIEHVGGLTYVLPNLPGLAIDEDKPLAWGEMRRDGPRSIRVTSFPNQTRGGTTQKHLKGKGETACGRHRRPRVPRTDFGENFVRKSPQSVQYDNRSAKY